MLIAVVKRGEEVTLPFAKGPCRLTGYTPLMALNRVFHDHGHLYAYDFGDLKALMAQAGFVDITRCDYRSGREARLLIDSEDRRQSRSMLKV